MAAPQSGELNFDALDDLLRQAEALDQQMRSSYPDIYAQVTREQGAAPAPAASFSAPQSAESYDDEFEVLPQQKSTQHSILPPDDSFDDDPDDIDEDSLQAYFLRRKFEEQPSSSLWEHGDTLEMISRMGDEPAQLPDDELFLYGLTKLCDGNNDEATRAIALMERRPGLNPLLAFLPVYTAPQLGASRDRISSLVNDRIVNSEESSERMMVIFAQKMLIDIIEIITEAEALQEAGYRNRQEALSAAAQKVRNRLSRLNY